MEVLLAKMTSSKDAATRYECMKALNTGLKEFERTAALSLNMVAGPGTRRTPSEGSSGSVRSVTSVSLFQ